MKVQAFVAVILGLFFAVVAANAANNQPGNVGSVVAVGTMLDGQTVAHRAGLSVADSVDIDATFATAVTEFGCFGRSNVPVSARFSASGQTCVVELIRYYKTAAGTSYFKGLSAGVTLVGGATKDSSGKYVAPDYVFDTLGATVVRVRLSTAPASGTVDFWVGSH